MTNTITKVKELNPDTITFTPLEDSDRTPSLKIGYIRYDEHQLKIQTPEICYEAGGIPRKGQFYETVDKRSHFKYPFCHDRRKIPNINYDSIQEFYDKLISIDQRCASDKFKKEMFGEKNYTQYAYQPLVKLPEIDEENQKLDKYGKPYYNPPTAKFKLPIVYEPNKETSKNVPEFSVFERDNESRKQVEFTSFEDFEKYVVWQSRLRFIVSFSKLYAMKTKSGNDKKKYGITLKVTCIEIKRPVNSNSNAITDAFEDSSDDEKDSNKPTISRMNSNNLDININDNDDINNEQNNEETNEDFEEEIIEEPKVVSKSKSKSKK